MKIEFKTITRNNYSEEIECHEVLVNGKVRLSQWEDIEPEDARFYRDLESPHNCSSIINEVIAAVRAGEEIEIEHTDEDDE